MKSDLFEELEVPEEIHELFIDMQAYEDCRDACIRSVFKAKKAIEYARKSRRVRQKAWKLVYALYPDFQDENLQYELNKRRLMRPKP